MTTRLYVGNLRPATTEGDLLNAFSEIAPVVMVKLALDRDTGRPRGHAFVSMQSDDGARRAMAAINGRNLHGAELRVSEAAERLTDARPFGASERRPNPLTWRAHR